MTRERLYLFDTTPFFSLPHLRGRVGEGVYYSRGGKDMPPPDALGASTSPAGGGGEKRRARP